MYEGEIQCPADRISGSLRLKPFRDTSFGRLAPEIRQMVFTNLLASPPAYGGHDFRAATELSSGPSPIPLATFVDLKGSCLAILQTCRQIHFEAFPVFYANKSYYVANAQDLVKMLGHRFYLRVTPGLFRLDTITSLCLGNIMVNKPKWRPEVIDIMTSRYGSFTRESLQAERTVELDSELFFVNFQEMKSLRKICLCILAGQERELLTLLFNLKGIGRGVIEFVDDYQWSIHSRNVSQDDWKVQYPGFSYPFYRLGKNHRILDIENIVRQKKTLDISSRASDLAEGDERWIEIDIGEHLYEETMQHHEEIMQNQKEAMQIILDGGTQHQANMNQSNKPAMVTQGGSTSNLQTQPRKSTQTCTKRPPKSRKMNYRDAHTPIDLVQSKKRAVRAKKNQKKLKKPKTPSGIPLTTVATRNSSPNPENQKSSLPITSTKLQLRATTLILALSLAYTLLSDQIEETISQMLTLFLAILLFFAVAAVFSEESG